MTAWPDAYAHLSYMGILPYVDMSDRCALQADRLAEVEAYLVQHNLRAAIQNAVNEVVTSNSQDPLADLSALLLKCK